MPTWLATYHAPRMLPDRNRLSRRDVSCRPMHAALPGLNHHPWPQGPRLTLTMPGDFPLCRGRLTVGADVSVLGQRGLIDVRRNRVMARPRRIWRQTKHRANRCERAAVDRRGAELSKR